MLLSYKTLCKLDTGIQLVVYFMHFDYELLVNKNSSLNNRNNEV